MRPGCGSTTASSGSSRGSTAAIVRPSGSTAGMSLLLCTARSISPLSSASSISLTNRRLPPTSDSGASCRRSPDVLMTTMRHGGPPAAAMRAATVVGLPQRELAAARAEPKLAERRPRRRRVRALVAPVAALNGSTRPRSGVPVASAVARPPADRRAPNSRVSASVYAPTVSASPSALSCSVGVSSSFSTMRRVISSTRARALRAAAPTA